MTTGSVSRGTFLTAMNLPAALENFGKVVAEFGVVIAVAGAGGEQECCERQLAASRDWALGVLGSRVDASEMVAAGFSAETAAVPRPSPAA